MHERLSHRGQKGLQRLERRAGTSMGVLFAHELDIPTRPRDIQDMVAKYQRARSLNRDEAVAKTKSVITTRKSHNAFHRSVVGFEVDIQSAEKDLTRLAKSSRQIPNKAERITRLESSIARSKDFRDTMREAVIRSNEELEPEDRASHTFTD